MPTHFEGNILLTCAVCGRGEMNSRQRKASGKQKVFLTEFPAWKVKEYNAGERITSQGEACTDVHYIEKGVVKLTLVSKRGKGAVLGILGEGDFFGEACIQTKSVYATSAIALVPTKISVIKGKAMLQLIEGEASVSKHFINYLVARGSRIEQDLIDHMFNFSEKRLARVLLLLAKSKQKSQVSAVLENIGQDTLAEMIGTTRSRVNFFMNKCRKLGFVHYNGGVTVHDSLVQALQD
jgi:CRP/FNR family transcriptional regulator, cyclic AMP receptor protein